MQLEELRVYQLAMEIGDSVWVIVAKWTPFNRNTLGSQIIRSSDSIAANISEGFGRYHYKDSKKFYYYSRGSLYETKTWLTKAKERDLLTESQYTTLMAKVNSLGKMLNKFIQTISSKAMNEDEPMYGLSGTNESPLTDNQ